MNAQHTMHKQQHIKCSHKLAKIAQTVQKSAHPATMSWHLLSKNSCCHVSW